MHNIKKKGELFTLFTIRIIGAIIASIGFFLIAYQKTIIGTSLIGIGSVLIAAGEK
mgnify:CR=1 FL=1